MAIYLDQPVIIEPIPQPEVYPIAWITSFVASFPSPTDGYLRIEQKPYNPTSGKILQTDPIVLSTDQLWTMIEQISSVKVAFDAILNAIPDIHNFIDAQLQNSEAVE